MSCVGTGAWIPVRTADGTWTLAHPVHGETCHSLSGAWHQARERYARACRLTERAREIAAAAPRADGVALRLLDVGTGLGLNLAAALEALDGTGVRLEAVSLEIDRRVIAATLALADRGDSGPVDLEAWHAPVRDAFARAQTCADLPLAPRTLLAPHAPHVLGSLRLVFGDARETLPALDPRERFDAVFLDGFSPRVDPALWAPQFLLEIARRMAPGSWLSTYSAAVSVRAGLFAAGLRVGPGARVGTKAAGTVASPDGMVPPFPPRLMRRLVARGRSLDAPPGVPGPQAEPRIPYPLGVSTDPLV